MREVRGEFLLPMEQWWSYRGSTAIALAFLLILSLSACYESPEETRITKAPRNLVLIVLDTLRADHVSCYGRGAQTPNIDRLANQGLRFDRAYSHIPVTGPSHSSMFTGLLPFQHGVEKNTDILADSYETLAESLKNRGYSTYAVVSLGVLKARFGFSQGFDLYHDDFKNQWFLRGEQVVDIVGSMLPARCEKPTFVFAHFSDPHEPYSPPGLDYPSFSISLNGQKIGTCSADGMGCRFSLDLKAGRNTLSLSSPEGEFKGRLGFRQLELRSEDADMHLGKGWNRPKGSSPGRLNRCSLPSALNIGADKAGTGVLSFFANEIIDIPESQRRYALEVEYADSAIGHLLGMLKSRGYLENSLIVFTGDHGEGMGQHGLLGHKKQVYDSLLRVPMIMVADGIIPAAAVSEIPVAHIDMNASIRDLLNLPPAAMSCGRPVARDILESRPVEEKPLLAMTFASSGEVNLRAAIFRDFKLIRNLDSGGEEFYDLNADPDELTDIFATSRISALSPQERKELEVLGSALDSVEGMEKSGHYQAADTAVLSPEERARLEALGYTQ